MQKRLGPCEDYVEGMWKILQHDHAEDFVLATEKFYGKKIL